MRDDHSWIQTYTGRCFYSLDPRPEDVDILDIGHALSMQCRFSGHTVRHYSVAQHSYILSYHVPERDALWGLLHDASEAYLVDLPKPIKANSALGAYYKEIENKIMAAVCERFGLPLEEPASVKEADGRMLTTEKRDLMIRTVDWKAWEHLGEPFDHKISPLPQHIVEHDFLSRFLELIGEL